MLGIICAMDEELEDIHELMNVEKEEEYASMLFYLGTINNIDVCAVRSGIGKVNASVCTQILIDRFGVDKIINTGIAGSLSSEVSIGDVVISEDVVHHDMDASYFGYEFGQVPRMDVLGFKADKKLIEAAVDVCESNDFGDFYVGRVVSGDVFVASDEVKARIKERFSPLCTEMEGSAIGHTAYLNKVPYVVIRVISDNADDGATVDYETFEKQAISKLVGIVSEMTKRL